MSDRTILIIVGVVVLYMFMKRQQPQVVVAQPAPASANPNGGQSQNVAQSTFNDIMALLTAGANAVSNIVNAQSSASTT